VFSKPGVYLVQIRIEADLIDGTSVADTQELRVAVGSETAPESAFAATWRGGESGAAAARTPAAVEDTSGSGSLAVVAIALAAGALLAGLAAVVMRGSRAKRRARA
jgi:surface-anchored protein